ncbi:MAG: hypothetical protein ABIG93_01365 [archaeon]|nr:hypothetical protein [Nanoarchaeota archaeon]
MKYTYLTLVFLISLLLLPLALADITVEDEDLVFEVSYESLDGSDSEVTVTHSVIFSNDGASSEDVTLTLSSENTDYTINFVDSGDQAFTVAAGASKTVSFEIVQDISGTDEGLEEEVASVLVETVSGQSTTFYLDANITSMIELKGIEFYLNGHSDTGVDDGDVNDDDVDVDVEPGDTVEMYFQFENLFDKDYQNGDIDITVNVDLEDNDFGDDINEDFDYTLDSGDKTDDDDDDLKIEFDVPSDAEDNDDYELVVTVEAEDENNVKYEMEWIIILEVIREDDDVRIDDVTVSPSSPSCGDAVTLTVEAVNYGTDDQDEALITVESSELGIDLYDEFSLDAGSSGDNSENVRFTFDIPDDTLGGTYELDIRVYYDTSKLTYTEKYDLVIGSCSTEDSSSSDSDSDSDSNPENDVVELVTVALSGDSGDDSSSSSTSSSSGTVNTVEKSFMKDEYIIAMMIITILAVLGLLFMVLFLALKK